MRSASPARRAAGTGAGPSDDRPNGPRPRADVPGTNLELIYANVEIAPDFKAGRHSHPGVVMAKVTEGEFWFALDGQPEKIFKTGEAFTVPDRAIHNEGATDKGVKFAVVYVVEKGKPLVSPAP